MSDQTRDYVVGSRVYDDYSAALTAFFDGHGELSVVHADGTVLKVLSKDTPPYLLEVLLRAPVRWPAWMKPKFLSAEYPVRQVPFSDQEPNVQYVEVRRLFKPLLVMVHEHPRPEGWYGVRLSETTLHRIQVGNFIALDGHVPVSFFAPRGPLLPIDIPNVEPLVPFTFHFTGAPVSTVVWGAEDMRARLPF